MAEQQLRLDLEELRHLESLANRPRVLSLLSSEIQSLDSKLATISAAAAKPVVSTDQSTVSATAAALNYVTLGSFSWDQDNERIKIYVFLEGVSEEKVETNFREMALDVKFHDVQGKNYRIAIPKLNKEIVPEKSKVLVKPTKVIISLLKASKGNWLDLHFKEDKFKPSADKSKDPMSGIMDLMRNMYDDGDDDMKRTIAKAWTDARSGKTADPRKGYDP